MRFNPECDLPNNYLNIEMYQSFALLYFFFISMSYSLLIDLARNDIIPTVYFYLPLLLNVQILSNAKIY